MYCEDSAWTDIDHFAPKATYPDLAFKWENYFAACSGCNSNYKRAEFPVDPDGRALLVSPVDDEPRTFLAFSPSTGEYVAVGDSERGKETIRVFGLNREVLSRSRAAAWSLMQIVIEAYATAKRRGDDATAASRANILRLQPFASVLEELVMASDADSDGLVSEECRQAVRDFPEIRTWPRSLFG